MESESKAESDQVHDFVFGDRVYHEDLTAIPNPEPTQPIEMTIEDVSKLGRWVFSEIMELINTVEPDANKASGLALRMLVKAIDDTQFKPVSKSKKQRIVDQSDAITDGIYFLLFSGAKHGLRIGKSFKKVHAANMNKRFPDGKFHARKEDGKIIKPETWKEPNLEEVFEDVQD